jgi:cobalt/nickel transport protein
VSRRLFLVAGLIVAFVLAGAASNFASSSPDGLDKTTYAGCTVDAHGRVTGGTCMAQKEQEHQFGDGPLAGYGIRGIDNEYLATGLSGVLGVALTFAVGGGVFWLVRRRRPVRSS